MTFLVFVICLEGHPQRTAWGAQLHYSSFYTVRTNVPLSSFHNTKIARTKQNTSSIGTPFGAKYTWELLPLYLLHATIPHLAVPFRASAQKKVMTLKGKIMLENSGGCIKQDTHHILNDITKAEHIWKLRAWTRSLFLGLLSIKYKKE